jgi:hypothetical protein
MEGKGATNKAVLPLPPFRYVMTDFTQHNIDFWLKHPPLVPLFEEGVLDCALFDAIKVLQACITKIGAFLN